MLDDEYRFGKIRAALADNDLKSVFNNREAAAFTYTRILTLEPASMTEDDISAMRDAGWDDAEILEINQVVSYFNYANRTVLGLGVTTDGDILGLSPRDSSDPENWAHH